MKYLVIVFIFLPQFTFCQNSFPIDFNSLSIHPIEHTQVNDLDYYYIEKGEGETIFFLHGFPDLAGTWDETISELSKNYRCIAPFLRGYYPTSIPKNGDYSSKTIANDIVQLAEQLGIDTYYIVGQDWGASVSYSVANLAPKKVKKLTTIAIGHPRALKLTPKLLFFGRHFIKFRNKKRAVKYTRKNNFAYLDKLYKRWSPDWTAYQETSEQIKQTFSLPGRLEAALGYYWSFFDERNNIENQKFYQQHPQMPFLFVGGLNDGGVSIKMVDRMKEQMPDNCETIIYNEAGHFLHREMPQRFISDLKNFLRQKTE